MIVHIYALYWEDALEGAQGLDLYLDRSLLGWVVDYCVVRCHFELGVFPE